MDKENGETDRGEGKGCPPDGNNLLDAASLFAYWPRGEASSAPGSSAGHSLFGGIPGGFANHLGHPLPGPFAMMSSRGSGPGYGAPPPPPPHPPTTAPGSYGSLGTLSVAASQAASLGITPASAAWWTMASHLAAQDYLARLQVSSGMFPGAEGLVPGYPLLSGPHAAPHSGGSSSSKERNKAPPSSVSAEPRSKPPPSSTPSSVPTTATTNTSRDTSAPPPNVVSDASSILGGVRLPPDTEIIKYTSSIVGPKVPGTTNRGRKKTISLDPPSLSVLPTHSSTGLLIERGGRGKSRREATDGSLDRVEVIKLPAHSSNNNGVVVPLNIPTFGTTSDTSSDAPLNLSLKPTTTSASSSLSSLSSLSASLTPLPSSSERSSSRRKPGPKPRRVAPPASPSPSLAQLFAAADSPRPPSSGEETDTHHKDGRPRNLGRGVSKPKKNTVASLLAQSRALGIKPSTPHSMSLLAGDSDGGQNTEDGGLGSDDMPPSEVVDTPGEAGTVRIGGGSNGGGSSSGGGAVGDEKQRHSMVAMSEDSVTSRSPSEDDSEASESHSTEGGPPAKRRRPAGSELGAPLAAGWQRETIVTGVGRRGALRGEVSYVTPCGRRLHSTGELLRFLQEACSGDLARHNFSFSPRLLLGDFLQPGADGDEPVRMTEEQLAAKLADLRAGNREKLREAKRAAREEAARHKEQVRLQKEQERSERQEAMRREREQRNQQLLEARRRRQEELEKQRQEEQLRKQQERELKRQQAVLLKEQLYIQELNKQREMLYTVELERERRRQHMALVKALESRKRLEERERRRQEVRAEKLASKERRLEQRRLELELVREMRKPAEDTELADHKEMPKLDRIPGLKISGQAFADTLMVFEFLHNFGETLGFDMDSLPTLGSLQNALLNDEEAEEELLSVMTHLLVCAIEDPGVPNPARHTTILGQSLRQADITHANLSEILRVYLYANATGEVKALTGMHFERDREKRSDHHNSFGRGEEGPWSGKNAAFFERLHDNPTWRMSEWLQDRPFLALDPTRKASILAFICNELLQNKAVLRQIDASIDNAGQLRRERWLLDTRIRKLRMLQGRKQRQAAAATPTKTDGEEEGDVEEEEEPPESDSEEPEEEGGGPEELSRKLERLARQHEVALLNLASAAHQLRATCFGQDRYWRRYWSLPTAGGVFVEGQESAEPAMFLASQPADEEDDVEEEEVKDSERREGLEDSVRRSIKEKPLVTRLEKEVTQRTHGDKEIAERADEEEEEDDDDEDEEEEEEKENVEGIKEDKESDVTVKQEDGADKQNSLLSRGPGEELRNVVDQNLRNSVEGTVTGIAGVKEEVNEDKSCIVAAGIKREQREVAVDEDGDPEHRKRPRRDDSDASVNSPWFTLLPREPCDSASPAVTPRGSEDLLRIPVFPPPPPSPSPSHCESPAPLTAEEQATLEMLRRGGLHPTLSRPRPIPDDLRRSWWRISDVEHLKTLISTLHTRGVRERELKRIFQKYLDNSLETCSKQTSVVREGDLVLGPDVTPHEVPTPDNPQTWRPDVALRVDLAVLEQVEALEDKVANASMQVKGWKVPSRPDDAQRRENPIEVAKERLSSLEAAIERRYLKPPLGLSGSADGGLGAPPDADEVPKGLCVWREAVGRAYTSAQIAMALYMLEASIAWDKSIMKANCQFCHSGDNEDKLLLCDGCDKGYHTYCFRPKMDNIPDGDWYCFDCLNKATGERNCIVCGLGKGSGGMALCDSCPRAFHAECLQPPLVKVPRGKWSCPGCCHGGKSSARRKGLATPSATTPAGTAAENAEREQQRSSKKLAREMAPCKALLDALESHDEAWPFLLPVNTKQFPTYRKIIRAPMDLSTVRKKLHDAVYRSRDEFCADVRLIFNNCETFNEDDSPVGKAGHSMRSFFESRWGEIVGGNTTPS